MTYRLNHESDAEMAEATAECLLWLAYKGRDGARAVRSRLDNHEREMMAEAADWLSDIADGKEI